MAKRLLPLQPPNTTPYYGFVYLTIFFVCIHKSYWISFSIPYLIINFIGYVIIKINMIKSRNMDKQKIYGQKRDYWTFMLVAALIYISIWQSWHNTSPYKSIIDYIIITFFLYCHFCVIISFMHFHCNLFAKFYLYRLSIGWIAELHYSTVLFSLYVFPVYPIISFYIYYGVMDPIHHKYSAMMIYVILYCYILHSLFLSFVANNQSKWIFYEMNKSSASRNKIENSRQMFPLKFNEYYVGNNNLANNSNQMLRVCQISDCHLDSLYTANELKILCENIVKLNPDLVLLTGDFYYTKNDDIPKGLLKYALSPLTKIANKCYGCLGNHDMKTKQTKDDIETCVVSEFEKLNIKLLRNESVLHDGNIEIIGFDFMKQNINNKRANMMKNVLRESKQNKCDLNKERVRIVLLHNPDDFEDFDGDENIFVFSGHIHGGHVGFYSLGSPIMHWFRDTSLYGILRGKPAYGVWRKGNNLLYIHRGNTLYSKGLLRFGVPAEQQSCIIINLS